MPVRAYVHTCMHAWRVCVHACVIAAVACGNVHAHVMQISEAAGRGQTADTEAIQDRQPAGK